MINIKKISKAGSITIPASTRRELGINKGDTFEIDGSKDGLTLKRHNGSCLYCETNENLVKYKNRYVCKNCLKEINTKNETAN